MTDSNSKYFFSRIFLVFWETIFYQLNLRCLEIHLKNKQTFVNESQPKQNEEVISLSSRILEKSPQAKKLFISLFFKYEFYSVRIEKS